MRDRVGQMVMLVIAALIAASAVFVIQDRIRNGPASPHRTVCVSYRTSVRC